MANGNDLSVLMQAQLDTKSSIDIINKQIENMSTQLNKLSIKVIIDDPSLKGLTEQIKQVEKLSQAVSKPISIFNGNELRKVGAEFTKITGSMEGAMNHVRKSFNELGRTTLSNINIDPLTQNITSFTVQVEESEGVVKKFKHTLVELENEGKAFKLVDITGFDKTAEIEAKRLKERHELRSRLAQEEIDNMNKLHQQASIENKRFDEEREKSLQYEQKLRMALEKQNIEEINRLHTEALRENKRIDDEREKTLTYEQKVRNAIAKDEENRQKQYMNDLHKEALEMNKRYDAEKKQIRETQVIREKSEFKHWQNLRQEAVGRITQTPDGIKELNAYYNELEKTSNNANTELKKLKESAVSTNNVLKYFGNSEQRQKADELTNSLKSLNITQNMTQQEMKETVAQAKDLSNQLRNVSKEAKATGNNSMTLSSMIGTAFEKFSVWIGITSVFFGGIRAIRGAVTEVISLNTAQTELNKILEVSREELEDYTEKSYELAETLGRTGKDVLDATAEFARAGYNLQESNKLAEQALLLTNISDGLDDTAESAGYLIAVMKGYGLEIENISHVTDLLNEVSNNFAVNTVELADGLQRTSGTLSQTGTSMEELAGILTGGYEVLRNMEKVSSGLITISQRLRGIGEDGKDIDGLMPKLQKTFKEVAGINIQTTNGELRSTYDILKDLSSVWGTLNDEQKQMIGELASGVHRTPVLNAILMNWQSVEGAVESATNSTGSAVKENEKYLVSLEGRINQLTSSLSKLAYNTISGGVVGTLIDLATFLVKVADAFGGIESAVFITITSLTLLNNKFQQLLATQVAPKMASWVASLTGLGKNASAIAVSIGGVTLSIEALTSALTIGLSLAIPLLIKGFGALHTSISEQKEIVESLSAKCGELKTKIEELRSVKNPSKDQEQYIGMLERELELKEAIQRDEEKKLMNKELFSTNPFKNNLSEQIKSDLEEFTYIQETLKETQSLIDETQAKGNDASFYIDRIHQLGEESVKLESRLIEAKDKIQTYINTFGKDAPKELFVFKDSIDSILPSLQSMNNLGEKGVETISDLGNSTNDNAKKSFEELQSSLMETIDHLQGVNDVLSDYNENGKFNQKSLLELTKTYPQLLAILGDEKSVRQELMSIIEQEEKVQKDAYYQMIQDSEKFYNAKIIGNATLVEELNKAYGVDLNQYRSLAEAKEKIDIMFLQQASSRWADFYDIQTDSIKGVHGTLGLENSPEINKIFQAVTKLRSFNEKLKGVAMSNSGIDFKSLNLNDTKNKSSSKKDDDLSDLETRYRDIESAIADLNTEISRNNTLMDTASDMDKISILSKEIELTTQLNQRLHELNNERKVERNEILTKMGQLGFEIDWDNKKVKNIEKIKSLRGEEAKLADDLIKKYDELNSAMADTSNQYMNNLNDIKKSSQEIVKLQENIIQESYEKIATVEDKIIQIIKKRGELEREELEKSHKAKLDSYNEDLEEFRDYINEKIGIMDKERDEQDYSKNLQNEQEIALEIQAKIQELSLDDSLEAKNKVLELQKQLAEQEEKIAEMKNNREYELRKENLSDQLKEEEKHIQKLIDKENRKYEEKKELLDEEYSDIAVQLEAQRALINGVMTDVDGKIVSLETAFITFENRFGEGLSFMGDKIKSDLIANLREAISLMSKVGMPKSSSIASMSQEDYAEYIENKRKWESASPEERVELQKRNEELRKKYGITSDNFSYSDLVGSYDNGGKITQTGMAQVHGSISNPEWVLRDYQLTALINDSFKKFIPKIQLPTIPKISSEKYQPISIDNLITVNGNVDRTVMPEIEKVAKRAVELISTAQERKFKTNGLVRTL